MRCKRSRPRQRGWIRQDASQDSLTSSKSRWRRRRASASAPHTSPPRMVEEGESARMKLRWPALGLAIMLVLATNVGVRAQQSTQDLAVAAQNPVAAMYSLPFQNNIYGGVGPKHDATANVLNIQPV